MPNSASAPPASAPSRTTSSASRFRWPISAPPLRTRWRPASRTSPSIVLQQPLEVIELDLRALRLGRAAAQLFENPAHALHVDLAGNLHRQVVGGISPAQRPAQRIALLAIALLAADPVAGTIALTIAVLLLLHRLEILRALAQGIQRLALRIYRAIRVTLAELAAGIAHRVVGRAEIVTVITGLRIAVLTSLLALRPLLAALIGAHAALGQFILQFLQAVAQTLLVLLEIAHGLIALLAALPVTPRILALLIGLVSQLLLLADHVAELVPRLIHLVIAGLAGLRELKAFQHLLQLVEQLSRRVLVARTRQPLQPVDHAVEVLLAHDPGVGIERPRQRLRIVAKLFGELADKIIERRAQILGELLDLFVTGAALQRFLERVLRRAKRLVDIGDVAILDRHRERPHARDNPAQSIVGMRLFELPRDTAQAEILANFRHEQFRRDQQRLQRIDDLGTLVGIERQRATLLNQRARQRLGEQTFGQAHIEGLAMPLIAGLILGRQRQPDVGAGVRIFAEVLDGLAHAVTGADIRQHQRELRRFKQRPRVARAVPGRELRVRFGDAVIVLDLVRKLQRAPRLTLRILGERDGRGMIGQGTEAPLRLAGRCAHMRGAVAGDSEMLFARAFGRLLCGGSFGETAAHHHVKRAAARAYDQRAAGGHRKRP